MVQNGKHHHGVEMIGAAVEEGRVFAVLPASCWRGMSEIDAQRKDILAASLQAGAESINGLHVGVVTGIIPGVGSAVAGDLSMSSRFAGVMVEDG